ncbi:MAG: tetratricopeptide repeat protein [Magnetococcales bacterium]|nr:tetratricopeptide repeat protein [Magnetococcales bacterium]
MLIFFVVIGFMITLGTIFLTWRHVNKKPMEAQDWKRNRAETLWKDAVDLQSKGNFAKALEKWKQSAFMESDSARPRPGFLGQVHNELGYCYFRSGQFKESEEHFTQSLAFFRKTSLRPTFDTAFTLNNYALLCLETGRHDQAMNMIRRSMSIFSASLGKRAPQMVHVLNNLARAHMRIGAYTKALEVIKESQEIIDHSLLPHYPESLLAKELLAETWQQLGNPEEAERLFLEVVASKRALHGPQHPEILPALYALGRFYRQQGARDKTRDLHECILGIVRSHFGPAHHFVGEFLNQCASLELQTGTIAAARPLLEESLAILTRANKTASLPMLTNLYLRLWLHHHDHSPEGGIPLLQQAFILLQIHELSSMKSIFFHLASLMFKQRGLPRSAIFFGKQAVNRLLTHRQGTDQQQPMPEWLPPPSAHPIWKDLDPLLRQEQRIIEAQALGSLLPPNRPMLSSLHDHITNHLKTGWQNTVQEQTWEAAMVEWQRHVTQIFHPEVKEKGEPPKDKKEIQSAQPSEILNNSMIMAPIGEKLDQFFASLNQ